VYEDLDYDSTTAMLKEWKEGREPKIGPQIDRQWSCGPLSRTSLHEIPVVPISRDFAAEKQAYDDAKAA